MSRKKAYWICQYTGWGLYGLLGSVFYSVFQKVDDKSFLIQAILVILMITATHRLRLFMKKRRWLDLSLLKLLFRLLPALLLIAFICQTILSLIAVFLLKIFTIQQFSFAIFWVYVFNVFVFLLLWSAVYLTFSLFRRQQQQEVDRWKLEASLRETELQALKSQINPHFLFNSLNNIRSLVCENPEQARHMITHLSELLRYGLQYAQQDQVPLIKELEVVQSYLLLESVQLEDRLTYTFEIAQDALLVEVPPMSVQLLVENAIKHGISRLPQGGSICIKAHVFEEQLLVEIINTGQLAQAPSSGTGIGLRNASERLRLLFGSSSLQLLNKTPDSVSASFAIPLTQAL